MMKFPTEEQWMNIEKQYDWERLKLQISRLYDRSSVSKYEEIDLGNMSTILADCDNLAHGQPHPKDVINLQMLLGQLQYRLADVQYAFVMLTFFKEQNDILIAISKTNAPMTERNLALQERPLVVQAFRFHVNACITMMFSAWDTIAHMLNCQYELKITKPDFSKTLFEKLKKKQMSATDRALHQELTVLINHLEQRVINPLEADSVSGIRNDIIHNHLPLSWLMMIYCEDINGISEYKYKLRSPLDYDYTIALIFKIIHWFEETINILHDVKWLAYSK